MRQAVLNAVRGRIALFGAMLLMAGCGQETGSGQRGATNPAAVENQYAAEVGGPLTNQHFGAVVASPEEFAGVEVDIRGQVFGSQERQGDELVFQMWADPANAEWNTVVRYPGEALLRADDYARVHGTVLGRISGENAFGGQVDAVEVEAAEVTKIDALEALDPTQRSVAVGRTMSSPEGLSVTLEKLDIGQHHTRAYITARNDGSRTVGFDFDRSKIVQGEDPAGYLDTYDYDYRVPQPRTNLRPGMQTEGVVVFRRVDPDKPLRVILAQDRIDYSEPKPDPLVFEAVPHNT